jgi:uronate dehydrogenase
VTPRVESLWRTDGSDVFVQARGAERAHVRIGSAFPEPVNVRMLAIWLSYGDFSRLIERCALTRAVGHEVICTAPHNARMTWWRDDALESLGWAQLDIADPFAGQLASAVSSDPVEERHMGGAFCSMEYSRGEPVSESTASSNQSSSADDA